MFLFIPSKGLSNILKLSCTPIAFTSYKVFLKKNKKRSETSLSASFPAWFLKKYLSCYILLTQFVISKPLSYCFGETIRFDVKASFASCPVSRLIRWFNKPGYTTKEFWKRLFCLVPWDFSWIKNYKLNWPNFIVWLLLLHGILANMCIAIVFIQVVTSLMLKLTLSFSSSHFFYMSKKSRQIFKYLEKKALLRWNKKYSSFLKGFHWNKQNKFKFLWKVRARL